jgi:Neprosin
MSGTTQEILAGSSLTAIAGQRASGAAAPAVIRHGRGLRRVGQHAVAWLILPAAFLSGQGPAAQASSMRAPAVHATAPAPQPARPGQHSAPKHYYYVTAFDSGLRSGVGPNTAHVQFYAKTDHLINKSDHSLTEIYTRDAAGNAVEVGVTTDTFWLPNARPHLFVSSWTDNKWNGYGTNAGFVSTSSSATPGVTEPPLGKYTEYGYKYSKGKMWVSYNNVYIGYFPASIWAHGWRTATESQTYAEAYASKTGSSALPAMNGSVRGYTTSTGSHFTSFTISAPYKILHASSHGFSFTCVAACHKS